MDVLLPEAAASAGVVAVAGHAGGIASKVQMLSSIDMHRDNSEPLATCINLSQNGYGRRIIRALCRTLSDDMTELVLK